uniref:Inositol oxygenase n=1 Tax=Aceria tosichella TaxID=561515 RepID=A0A6G1S7N2_9ACAR
MAAVEVIYRRTDEELGRAEEEDRCSSTASSSPEPSYNQQGSRGSFSSSSDCTDQYQSSEDDDEHEQILVLDPSEHYRPEEQYKDLELHGKQVEEFRRYSHDEDDHIQRRVKLTYYEMHKNQTVEFVRQRTAKWTRFDHAQLTIMEALEKLNDLIDESDPDSDLPNIVHAFQTAERIRAVHPDKGWLQLTGLIHDLGKILVLFGESQWAVVGDTYPVGCQFAPSIVYREHSFDECPDLHDERYNSKLGIYEPNCGLDRVMFSWGHDEYMARVLMNHESCSLPPEAIRIIRLHSFYPWHSGGDYMHLCNEQDLETIKLIREFNKFDLYTKSSPVPDIEALTPYYQSLIDKYIPGKLKW